LLNYKFYKFLLNGVCSWAVITLRACVGSSSHAELSSRAGEAFSTGRGGVEESCGADEFFVRSQGAVLTSGVASTLSTSLSCSLALVSEGA
jgi:hypothetical protein